jgi:hypothetical protein
MRRGSMAPDERSRLLLADAAERVVGVVVAAVRL